MHYLVHLTLPAIFIAAMIWGGVFGKDTDVVSQLPIAYATLAAPYWVWAGISAYFNASQAATNGGFIGAHALLLGVAFLVAQSNAPEAGNGWFLFLLLSPLAITVAALAARWLVLSKGANA